MIFSIIAEDAVDIIFYDICRLCLSVMTQSTQTLLAV